MAQAQAIDAHSSFVYLVNNLPIWQASIDSLAAHTEQKNAEFVAEYTRLVNQARPKRKKSPSLSSIHINEARDGIDTRDNTADGVEPVSAPDSQLINPLEAGNRYLYAQARRKRKPGPSVRSGASGSQKFRNKNHVVVYYDGYLQEQLDSVVKQVGIGRNNLRKGKHAFAAATGFKLPTLSLGLGPGLSTYSTTRPPITSRSTSALLPTKNPAPVLTETTSDEKSFLLADKELEQIQSLCETAAHQFLRDGDCRTELDTIRTKLGVLLVQATKTSESLKKLQEAKETDDEESLTFPSVHDTGSDTTRTFSSSLDLLSTPKLAFNQPPSPLITHPLDSLKPLGVLSAPAIPTLDHLNEAMADAIEVDDTSDQESIVVDLTQYRLADPRRARV